MLQFSFLVLSFVFILIAITVHEFSHALAADLLGDPTPRYFKRLTLNPIAHIDPIGLIMLIVVRFGWAKPVPINPLNFNNPRRDAALVSLAGPISNFIFAFLLGLVLKYSGLPESLWRDLIGYGLWINLALGVFNLIPVPPLDGSKILSFFLPYDMAWKLENIGLTGTIILLFILLSPFSSVLTGIINWLYQLLT